jgi:squalene-associated FAD-dependent desaturase
VTLLEKRPRLGGAAFSFRRGKLIVDNGQHVFLRCCTAYLEFLNRIGGTSDVTLQSRLDIPVLRPDGRSARISRLPGVPAPAHLGAALAGYSLLSPVDRLRAVRGALALRRLDPTDRRLDESTFGQFLRAHGQNDATIRALWAIVGTATLNLAPDEGSLALAAKVFRAGLLDEAAAADVGYAAVPLGHLHATLAERALRDAGVEVLRGWAVTSVEPGATVAARGPDSERLWRDARVVLATPPAAAFAAAPCLQRSRAAAAAGLRTTSIVNVHVLFDRTVTDLPFAAAVDSPVQWFFDRTDSSGFRTLAAEAGAPEGQYLAVTVSAADDIVDEPSSRLEGRFAEALKQLLPGARSAKVLDAFVTRQRDATFRQEPGTWARRPAADTGLDWLWVAGAWTDTGWPDTMEGAVRSGVTAADAVMRNRSTPAREEVAA